jgi:hypothetical protein
VIPPPTRIQRKRTKGARMPSGAVYVGRPSRWGNPFRVALHEGGRWIVVDENGRWMDWYNSEAVAKDLAVIRFANALHYGLLRVTVDDVRRELRGKMLACWCPIGAPCHADVLLEVANG